MQSSKTSVQVGGYARFYGAIKPGRSGVTVALQKRVGTTWSRVGSKQTGAEGVFSFRVQSVKAGRAYYRVVAAAAGRMSRGFSNVKRLDTYRWRYLSRMPWHEDGDWNAGAATIAGNSYPESVWADNNFWGDLEINLDGKCRKLAGVAGLTNESDSGSRGTLAVLRDGSEIYSHELEMTSRETLALDIAGTLRLALHMTTLTGSTFPNVAVGNAKVYCRS